MTLAPVTRLRGFRGTALAAAAAGVLLLSACGGGGESAPAESEAGAEATTEAAATTYTEEQLKAAIASLDVDGATFKDLPVDGTGADGSNPMDEMEIEPAECKELISAAMDEGALKDLTKAAGINGDTQQTVSLVGDAPADVVEDFAASRKESAAKCSELKITIAGQTVEGSTTPAEATVEGADSAEGSVTSISVAGTETTVASVSASAGSVIVTTTVGDTKDVAKAADLAGATLKALQEQG